MACERCDGTGKLTYEHEDAPVKCPDGTIITSRTSGTRACPCVRDLPPVVEEATWWESETVWSRVHAIPIHDDRIEVDVDAEVPRTKNGRRAVMRGNRYYPTLIHVEQPERLTLSADDAIEYAGALMAAAYAAKAVDDPCEDCWAKDWSEAVVPS